VSDLKQAIKQNYIKCAKEPSYFINQYCTIQHPQRGKIKFKLYPFQFDVLKEYQNNDYNVILKSRQLGISTLSAAYSLWMMLFQNDKNILVIATTKDTAKNLITKVRVMYEALPAWLKTAIVENNKLSLVFKNGSQIKAIASNESAGRSEALSLLILDEAAFIEKIDVIWTAAQQTLATGGRCLAISTPNGVGNWFHKTWVDATDGLNKFNTVKLHWTAHPERDETWRQEQNRILGPSQAAQECDADFLSSGRSVVDPLILEWYKEKMCCEPSEKSGFDRNLWIWNYPDYSKKYLICADVARGDGTDYSAAQVFDIEEMEQVAEYKGQLGTTEFGNFLIELATKYNDALLVVENNNIGWATLQTIIDRGYENLFYQEKNHLVVDEENHHTNRYRNIDRNKIPGFSTTMKSKPLIVAKMEEYTREKMVKLKSTRLIDELFVFIYKNNKTEALDGYNDDLVMSYSILLWIRDTAIRIQSERNELQSSMIGAIGNLNERTPIMTNDNRPKSNPYEIDIKGEKEDLTWLLG
jgi:hypothetical protein